MRTPDAGEHAAQRDTPAISLHWPNKDLLCVADGEGYTWVDRSSPRATAVAAIDIVGRYGQAEPESPANLLLQGDALDALRALPGHAETRHLAGSIRLAYLDPPFNTKQGYGHYRDDLEPALWLSMLRDRLAALMPLLREDASVWLHLDDAQAHHGRALLEEVFGPAAFVATVVWRRRTTRDSRAAFSSQHDYLHVFSPMGGRWKATRNRLPASPESFRNPDDDPRGPWKDAPFTAPGYRKAQQYVIRTPSGNELSPPPGRSWFATETVYRKLLAEGRLHFPRNGAGSPRLKIFRDEATGLVPPSLWLEDVGTNDDATRHLMDLFPGTQPFATPKPEPLLARILHIATDPGDVVLDCFAGSGTTAATAHKLGRRWVTVERSPAIVETFTMPRLCKVVTAEDTGGVTAASGWSGGGGFMVGAVRTGPRRRRAGKASSATAGLAPSAG